MTYARKMGQEHKFKDVSPEATAESDAGLTAFERGDLVAAERHLRRADQLGGHWGAFRLGFLLEETGRPAEAEEAYRRAVDRGSRSAAVNLGHMLERRNDRAGAIEAYTTALRLGDVRSMRQLAALGQSVINTPDGVTVHQGTIWGLNVVMARDAYAAGKLTVEAYEQTLREAIERSRDGDAVTLAMANLGQLVESRGDFEQAEGLFRRVVAEADPHEPFHAASTLALANLVWQRGDGAEAGVWWRRAMLSGDSEAAPKAAFNLGAALIMQGRLEEAVEALRLAIDSGHPDEAPGASVRLGVARALQGDLGAARAAYDFAAASGHPEFAPQALVLLAALDGQQPSTPSPRPPVTEPTREAPPTGSKRGAGHKLGGRVMPLWRRNRGSGKEATPSPTGQMLAEGWNGFRWGASLPEFKARFPQATEAAERSWATGLAQEPFCGIQMTTRYFSTATIVSAGWRSSPRCQTGNGCRHSSSTSWAGHPTATICSGSSAPSR